MLGLKILEEVTSPINGKVSVVKSLGLGTYIQVENLTQSGGVVYDVWRDTLKEIKNLKLEIKNCLILGLGGGSAATLVQKYWPNSKITGVDIDPIMVEMGKKYMGLTGVEAIIEDAEKFLLTISRQPSTIKYDLVLVDTYLGDKFPKEFERDDFLVRVKALLSDGGIAIFNRLYYDDKRPEAMKFGAKLERVFAKVRPFFPEANVMFLCYNSSRE